MSPIDQNSLTKKQKQIRQVQSSNQTFLNQFGHLIDYLQQQSQHMNILIESQNKLHSGLQKQSSQFDDQTSAGKVYKNKTPMFRSQQKQYQCQLFNSSNQKKINQHHNNQPVIESKLQSIQQNNSQSCDKYFSSSQNQNQNQIQSKQQFKQWTLIQQLKYSACVYYFKQVFQLNDRQSNLHVRYFMKQYIAKDNQSNRTLRQILEHHKSMIKKWHTIQSVVDSIKKNYEISQNYFKKQVTSVRDFLKQVRQQIMIEQKNIQIDDDIKVQDNYEPQQNYLDICVQNCQQLNILKIFYATKSKQNTKQTNPLSPEQKLKYIAFLQIYQKELNNANKWKKRKILKKILSQNLFGADPKKIIRYHQISVAKYRTIENIIKLKKKTWKIDQNNLNIVTQKLKEQKRQKNANGEYHHLYELLENKIKQQLLKKIEMQNKKIKKFCKKKNKKTVEQQKNQSNKLSQQVKKEESQLELKFQQVQEKGQKQLQKTKKYRQYDWTIQQNIKFVTYLLLNKQDFEFQLKKRKTRNSFKLMGQFLETKTNKQCHVQFSNILSKIQTIEEMIDLICNKFEIDKDKIIYIIQKQKQNQYCN